MTANSFLFRMTATVEAIRRFNAVVSMATACERNIGISKAKLSAIAVVNLSFVRALIY